VFTDHKSIDDFMEDIYVNRLMKDLPNKFPEVNIEFTPREVIDDVSLTMFIVTVYTVTMDGIELTSKLRKGTISQKYDDVLRVLSNRIEDHHYYKLKQLGL